MAVQRQLCHKSWTSSVLVIGCRGCWLIQVLVTHSFVNWLIFKWFWSSDKPSYNSCPLYLLLQLGVAASKEQDFGTANLHLEVSDVVSVLVYVGVAKGNGVLSKTGEQTTHWLCVRTCSSSGQGIHPIERHMIEWLRAVIQFRKQSSLNNSPKSAHISSVRNKHK